MSRIPMLVDSILRLKRMPQKQVAERAGLNPSNLNKFLNGHTDIKLSSLQSILDTAEIDIESLLEHELEKLMGSKKKTESVGEAFETLISATDPITAKTIIESLANRSKSAKDKTIQDAVIVMSDFKSKLATTRRTK